MENKELLQRLEERGREQKKKDEKTVEYRKYVVFSLGNSAYALPATDVKEISFDNTIYFVPFVPPYIRGFANRHGQPYTVFDLDLLFKNEKLESDTLLILNLPGDQACLLISDVNEIIKVPTNEVHTISSEDESSRYFLESVELEGKEVFVLNAPRLLERLERDLER